MSGARDEVLSAWLLSVPSAATRSAYGRDMERLIDFAATQGLDLLALSGESLSSWRDAQADASPATVARRMSAASSFFRYAAARGFVAANPAASVERPQPAGAETFLSEEESRAVLLSAQDAGSKSLTLVCLLLLEGLRLDAALSLEVGHVRPARAVSLLVPPAPVRLGSRSSSAVLAQVAGRSSGPLLTGQSAVDKSAEGRLTRFGAAYLLKRTGRLACVDVPVSAALLRRTWRRHYTGL